MKWVGEDIRELFRSIQDVFQIQLPEDGPCPETVGELCDIVVGSLQGTSVTSVKTCLTSVAFYRVRAH